METFSSQCRRFSSRKTWFRTDTGSPPWLIGDHLDRDACTPFCGFLQARRHAWSRLKGRLRLIGESSVGNVQYLRPPSTEGNSGSRKSVHLEGPDRSGPEPVCWTHPCRKFRFWALRGSSRSNKDDCWERKHTSLQPTAVETVPNVL